MKSSIGNFCLSFDSFGQPIAVNYNGNSSYQTGLGAFCTLALRGFLLVYSLLSFINLIQYQDPQITQYTIQDDRTEGNVLNFGELRGGIAFGFFSATDFTFPEIPARLGYIEMSVSTFSYENFSNTPIKVLDLEPISPEKQPYAFYEGGSLTRETYAEGLKVPVNSREMYFNKTTEVANNAYINLSVMKCDQARLPDD